MANERNLEKGKATRFKSGEQAAKAGAKGGRASQRKRRERKTMQELAKIVLDMPYEGRDVEDIEGLNFDDSLDANLTVGQRALLAVAKKAMRGDTGALAFLRDTAGERPVDKVEVSGNVEGAAAEIRGLIAKRKAQGDAG